MLQQGRAHRGGRFCTAIDGLTFLLLSSLPLGWLLQEKEDWINSIGRAIVRHSRR